MATVCLATAHRRPVIGQSGVKDEEEIALGVQELSVKLDNGATYYFPAGIAPGEQGNRIEMLREAIENDSVFQSVDINGNERTIYGSEVKNYHLSDAL